MKNTTNSFFGNTIAEALGYVFLVFLLMSIILILFFYFSRRKIIQKEIEKKDLEINYQKELLRSIIITQEEERKRIAQDLHDDISSKLNVVSLNTHLLKTPNLSDEELLEITSNITSLTQKALENSRRIAHDLLPPVLEKFGLHAGIEELVVEVTTSKIVTVKYTNNLTFDFAETDRHLHIFRILQELINNSIRHGKATEITILFDFVTNRNTCLYTDNGVGFDNKDHANLKGLGMKNIESRVNFLNGTLKIQTAINKGVAIQFNF